MTAPWVIDWSWQWSMIGRPNIPAYSAARRMSSLDWTQSPSSVIATTPARLSEPIGASAWPFRPTVMQPVGSTFTTASRPAASLMNWIVPALSAGGEVLGMQTTVVKPPAAAAREPVPIVSLWVWPGSRKCTWMSTSPGQATRPRPSIFRARLRSAGLSEATIRPSRTKRSAGGVAPGGGVDHPGAGDPKQGHGEGRGRVRMLAAGGDGVVRLAAGAEVEDGHPDGDAVGHLLEDDAALAVGQFAVDLHAAVDRARDA